MATRIVDDKLGAYQKGATVLFWTSMYLFWLGFNSKSFNDLSFNSFFTFIDFMCFGVVSVLTNVFLIPKLVYEKKYLNFLTSYLILIFLVTTIMLQLNLWMQDAYLSKIEKANFWKNYRDLAGSYILTFFLSSTAATFKLANDWYSSQQIIGKLSEEKLKTELEFLKNQINPHSFFNILNTIYFQIDFDKAQAKDTLLEFAKIFRYQLYEFDGEKVGITKEIEFIKGYIELHKKRFDTDYQIEAVFDISTENASIAPFLLLPIIENSFKHISQFTDKPNIATINVSVKNQTLICLVTNTVDKLSHNETKDERGGIGLKNLNRRLELLYINKYELKMANTNGIYEAYLKIIL